jgi:uncharacterized membrane protein
MSGARNAAIVVCSAALVLFGAACGQTVKRATPSFSPVPTPSIPTTLPPQVQAAFCQHLADLAQTISQVQASPRQAASQVHTSLSNAAAQLQSDQQQMQAAGQPQLAAIVQSVITAVTTLDQSIPRSGKLPSGISTGLAIVSGAMQQIPASFCPPPTS